MNHSLSSMEEAGAKGRCPFPLHPKSPTCKAPPLRSGLIPLDDSEHLLHNHHVSVASLRLLFAFTPECRSAFLRNRLDPEEMSLAKLHGVDANGIWIECQDFTDAMMKKCHLASSVTTPVLFVPFASIEFIVGSLRSLALSETAFGLSGEDG